MLQSGRFLNCRVLQESYPSTPPIWFVDSDDPSLAEVLERLEDVRKGSTLVSRSGHSASPWTGHRPGVHRQADRLSQITFFVPLVGPAASPATEAPHLWFMSTLQPASTSGCGNARSAAPCRADYSRAKGTDGGKISLCELTMQCFCTQSVLISARALGWGDVWGVRGGRDGGGNYSWHWSGIFAA